MNIFGIGPIEFLIIIVLGLVVFGPERLPGIGRSIGRMVARVLAWQYTSPEAQMLMEIRRDLEKEINDIRDEMIRARDALDIRSDIAQTLRETQDAVRETQNSLRDAEVAIHAPVGAPVAAAAPNAALLHSVNGAHPPPEPPPTLVSPAGEALLTVDTPAATDIVSPSGEALLEVEPLPVLAADTTPVLTAPDYADFPVPPVIGQPALQAMQQDATPDFPVPPSVGAPTLQVVAPGEAPNFADFPTAPLVGSPALQVARPAETLVMQPSVDAKATPAAPAPAEPAPVAATRTSIADFDLLVMQIQSLANDVAAMREQLQRNGLLDDGWKPTSALLQHDTANGVPATVED